MRRARGRKGDTERERDEERHVDSFTMQPSRTKQPGAICDRFNGDLVLTSSVGTRGRPALRIKVAINTATGKECPMHMPFRHPASSLHPRSVMTHEFRFLF